MDASSVFKLIKNRFIEIKNELGLKQPIEKELDAFYTNLNQMSQAVIVSRGEYFCAKLMAEYLGYAFVDAKDIIRFKLDKSITVPPYFILKLLLLLRMVLLCEQLPV